MSSDETLNCLEQKYDAIKRAYINLKKAPKARITKGYIQIRLQGIEDYWQEYKLLHDSLLKITKKQEMASLAYFQEDHYSKCEEEYFNVKTELQDFLNGFSETVDLVDRVKKPEFYRAEVKLPKINLPSFSGRYEEWQAFEDAFGSLILDNHALNQVQKLHYLKCCVTGEAAACIKQFQITESNFLSAWELLKGRYSHKRLIVNAILQKIFSPKKMNCNTSASLKYFVDNMKECLNSLQNIRVSIDSWDPMLIYLASQRFDQDLKKEWEDHVSKEDFDQLPKWNDLVNFLEKKIRTLELTSLPSTSMPRIKERVFHATVEKECRVCQDHHAIWNCKEFGKYTPEKRSEYARQNRLCYNCLIPGHTLYQCRQKKTCQICHKRHHSLLHKRREDTADRMEDIRSKEVAACHSAASDEPSTSNVNEVLTYVATSPCMALLATALVQVKSETGQTTTLRALIDQGSQANFITERAAQALRLKRTAVRGTVTGVGSTETTINGMAKIEISSRYDRITLKVDAYIMPTHLTKSMPQKIINPTSWKHIQGLALADPGFNQPGRVDLLLGVEVVAEILRQRVVQGLPGSPCAQETALGWILFGAVEHNQSKEGPIVLHHHLNFDSLMKAMWEVNPTGKRQLTEDERLCEKIYQAGHTRREDGRYIVKLPMKVEQPLALDGQTREIAMKRFSYLERKLMKNEKLKKEYSKVIDEYIALNHAEVVPDEEIQKPSIYLPHHAIFREDKESTKTRVVFDASSKGCNGKSLNDDLLIGPILQEDLRSLIMRWRMKQVCFVADISMMYRQVLVTPRDADYQRILWRFHENEGVKDLRLLTVTFGTASAPFLAVRTLQQIADDESITNPEAYRIIKEDFYMDDLMSGADTFEEALNLAESVSKTLKTAGFELKKWCSNSKDFLKRISPDLRSSRVSLKIKLSGVMKALGVAWDIGTDSFTFSIHLPEVSEVITKRSILSEIQRFFDPLGWLSPATIQAKLLMQNLWLKGLTWDEDIPDDIKEEWLKLRRSFEEVNQIKLKRWLNTTRRNCNKISLHGFCDASTKAYAAVVYLRVETENKQFETSIIAARTRVAPVKPISLPRLELCGAVILSQLIKQITVAMRISTDRVFCWTDSMVVLAWLKGDPGRWNVFVSNRIVEILDITGNQRWFHVRSSENPADLASRGITVSSLVKGEMWWNGPPWLATADIPSQAQEIDTTELEMKVKIQTNLKVDLSEDQNIDFERYDSLTELLRVIVYAKRFINSKKQRDMLENEISTRELDKALLTCLRIIQRSEFKEDVQKLEKKENLAKNSRLKALNPYLDEEKILRVGGRLQNSLVNHNTKHPAIVGSKNDVARLIISDAHDKTMHGGVQLMMNYIRARFWMINAKRMIKAHIHRCLICARHSAKPSQQIMGALPESRVIPARPFLHSGVDFAGPYQILMSKNRGQGTQKAYIAIFVCMGTKAIHLELVGDLTTDSFIGAFRRFIARRGRCAHIWSDQGTNFVGANRELNEAFKQVALDVPDVFKDLLTNDGTQWHFNPPHSPNFGGLWEAGVKSVKFHLKRILNCNLTFEELTTILCQIEACLNSRPLIPMDDTDPDNINPLTAGHFLIGESPINVPDINVSNVQIKRLSRWQLTQRLVQHFWQRWQSEYLTQLQQRYKWQTKQKEFEIGDIVLIKEDNLPPGKWVMGRILQKHPGADKMTRVYTITAKGRKFQRPVTKLCKLPLTDEH